MKITETHLGRFLQDKIRELVDRSHNVLVSDTNDAIDKVHNTKVIDEDLRFDYRCVVDLYGSVCEGES